MLWEQELEQIKQQGTYRQLRTIEAIDGSTKVLVDGRQQIMFASNNYLGLAQDPRLIQAAIQATVQHGTGSTGSRLTTGNSPLHEKLEKRLAQFKQTEAAIVLNTGYMANIAALTTLVDRDDVILSDELNHASIIDGCRLSRAQTLVYRHLDYKDLEAKLQQTAHYRRRLIVTDGVFSMDGDIAPLPEIVALAERYDALVMVDDAHTVGVLGEFGRGTVEHFGLHGKVAVQMGTLSKAVGAEGGYIAGSHLLIDYLLNCGRPFIFSTALPAGVVASALQAIEVIESEPERRIHLRQMSNYLYASLLELGYTVWGQGTPILAVICGEAQRAVMLSQALSDHGIFAPAIRPPTVPAGTSRIRLTVMATHQENELEQVIDVFRKLASHLKEVQI
jgi:8-amino-7-oxononanoate synthase